MPLRHCPSPVPQGPDPLNSDEPARLGKDLTDDERKEIVLMAYNQLQTKFKTLMKPDGSAEAPAKTCRDLAAAYPDKPNGQSPQNCFTDKVYLFSRELG